MVYVSLEMGESVFVVVDGGSKQEYVGFYKLSVGWCSLLCENKVCGSDGCGGSCGMCVYLELCKSN